MEVKAARHDAFISYRTSRSFDREVAEGVQKALERYPVPWSLRAGLVQAASTRWKASRLRVFRDTSDLCASPDLWEAVRGELLCSRWLIVVCSPATPESDWIRKELSAFLESHGGDRIIVVLIEGDPDESIPRELRTVSTAGSERGAPANARRTVERLAADLRAPDAKSALSLLAGWRTPREKQRRFDILAPILGLRSRDQLVQRHRVRVRRQIEWATVGVLTVGALLGFLGLQRQLERARAEAAEVRADQAETRSELEAQQRATAEAKTMETAARLELEEQQREAIEREKNLELARRKEEASLRLVAQAYRHRYTDPFTAAAEVYRSTDVRESEDANSAMAAVHEILLERRAISVEERSVTKHGPFSFIAQSTEGQRFTKLSRDGRHVLVVTERKGDRFTPELRGEAYVLDNTTLQIVALEGCTDHAGYRLEFADFVAGGRVLVARAFYVHLYTTSGECLSSFQLQGTKTPVTAAGGMLDGVFFITGNGAGCVWVEEYGQRGLIEPAAELGAVQWCDDADNADAVLQILVAPQGDLAVNVFQSGRVDLFALDGRNGEPRRRPVLEGGAQAVAFRRGRASASLAIAYRDPDSASPRLMRWDIVKRKPRMTGDLELGGEATYINFLGFSEDGEYLIGLDTACSLHYWDFDRKVHLFARPAGDLVCKL